MKRILSIALALTMVLAFAVTAYAAPSNYSVGTASAGGMMYAIGSGWVNVMNDALGDKYSLTAEETAGNNANIAMIENGEIDFCANGDLSIYEAYIGEANWTGGNKYEKIRVMFPLCQMVLTAYTLEENNITTLSDLDGKVVGLGSAGSIVDGLMRSAFEILGIKPADIYNDGWTPTVAALEDGRIDAGITFQLAPAAALAELEATHNMAIVKFSDEDLAAINSVNPALSPAVIAAGSYKCVTEDVNTLGDISVMCASTDIPDDVVYDLVKATYEHVDDMQITHNAMANWDISRVGAVLAEFHPGAVKYFEEVGVELPVATIIPASAE